MRAYQLGLYEKAMPNHLSFEEKLKAAAEAGFDYMEMSIDESEEKLSRLEWSNEQITALRVLQAEIGLPIMSICLSGHRKFPLGDPDPDVRSIGMDIMEKAIGLAAKLGVRLIQIAGYDVYYKTSSEETKQLFMENLRRSVSMASTLGVTLAFETMETDFMNTVDNAMAIVSEINSPWLQIYPDLGNITNASLSKSKNVNEDLKIGQGHLAAMHLKETKPGVFREVPFGTGHVDFKTGVKNAYQQGVRLFVGEFWYTGEDNWKEILSYNAMFLRKTLEAVAARQ